MLMWIGVGLSQNKEDCCIKKLIKRIPLFVNHSWLSLKQSRLSLKRLWDVRKEVVVKRCALTHSEASAHLQFV